MDHTFVYIVFSSTAYRIGKFVRLVTKEPYNHVSIAFGEDLTEMYSFARRYHCTPFYGGFVRESLSRYHHSGVTADIRICKLPVPKEQYEVLRGQFAEMLERKEDFPYNHLSAWATPLRFRIKARDAYTCVEFCVHTLHQLGIPVDPERVYSTGQLEQLLRPYMIYTGPAPEAAEFDAEYYDCKPIPHPFSATVSAFFALFRRLGT